MQKSNIQTLAGVRLLLTAALISFHTAFFWLPLMTLFRLPNRNSLFRWTSGVIASISASAKFLFFAILLISMSQSLGGKACQLRIHPGVIGKLRSFSAVSFIKAWPVVLCDWQNTNISWINLVLDDFCARICADFYPRLINEGHCVHERYWKQPLSS